MYITKLLTLHNQLKIFHWQTSSFAEHEAFGKAYDQIGKHIDQFMEVLMGKYGNRLSSGGFTIELSNYREKDPVEFIKEFDLYLSSLDSELKNMDSDLLNIRDEMKATLNQTLYLIRLK